MIGAPRPEIREPYSLVMDVGPELAERWLSGNIHNRKLNNARVDRMVRDMKAGRWHLTHQGVAFDPGSVLIDGQHRLWAVVLSGLTVRMRVFFNEPAENLEYIDTGTPRSDADVLTLTGRVGTVDKGRLAALRTLVWGLKPCTRLTVSEEADLLARHRAALDFALENLSPSSHVRGVATGTTRGVVARAYYTADVAALTHFCDVLRTGMGAGDRDKPIVMLRDFLVNTRRAHNKPQALREHYGKIERALAAFLEGRPLVKLYSSTTELFPLPGEAKEE
jgi:hypothetical protein